MIPQIPLNYIWQHQNYGRRGDRDVDPGDNYLGRSSADQSMLSAHSQSILGGMQTQIYQTQHQQQAAGRASQYLAHSFYTNLLPLLDQIFPGNPGRQQHWFQYFELFKQANFEKHFSEVEYEWAKIATLLTELLDPSRQESLSVVCSEPDRYVRSSLAKSPLKVQIESILPERTVRLICEGRLAELAPLYHNLQTDRELQKRSLEYDRAILLSPWEAFCIFFMRSISGNMEDT